MKSKTRARSGDPARRFLGTGPLLCLILFLLAADVALAAGDVSGYAWSTAAGWINFAPEEGGVTVYDDHLEGYAWGENFGWLRLGSYDGGGAHTYANDAAGSYGVNNDGVGHLSGFAWSATAGWINFDPDGAEQVTIDPATGDFGGYAWGENIGWIKFNGIATDNTTYKVATAGPFAVTLAFFDAQQVAGHVLVAWETVSKSNNAGFNLYRAASAAGPLTLLVYVPAQAPGSTQGATYRYEDGDVQPGQTWWYTLEDVDLAGATTRHEPVVLTVGRPTAVGLAGFSATVSGPWLAGLAALALVALAGAGLRRRGGR